MRTRHYYRRWKYKNTALLILSLVVFYFLAETEILRNFINSVGGLGYLGIIIAGIFFVSIFTVAPAAVVLFYLAEIHNPMEVALLAGFGAVIGDYIIFKFLKDNIFVELTNIYEHVGGSYLTKLFHTPYFSWLLPVMGAAIIASPLPDEVGVGILGLTKIKNWQFVLITFCLNTAGIFAIISAARILS